MGIEEIKGILDINSIIVHEFGIYAPVLEENSIDYAVHEGHIILCNIIEPYNTGLLNKKGIEITSDTAPLRWKFFNVNRKYNEVLDRLPSKKELDECQKDIIGNSLICSLGEYCELKERKKMLIQNVASILFEYCEKKK